MLALRRAVAHPLLRNRGYCVGTSRACCTKLITSTDDIQHSSKTFHHGEVSSSTFHLLAKRFYRSSSSNVNFATRSCGLSSQAGAENSEDEDNLEDGFSELETPASSETIGEKTAMDDDDGLLSEPELSDDDNDGSGDILDKVSHQDELELSETEAEVAGEISRKKKTSLDLFKVLMDAPRNSSDDVLNKYVEKGNSISRTEVAMTMLNLRKRKMYGKALQLSEWLEGSKHIEMEERDYASRVDLIYKVRGPYKAEKYIDSIPQSFRGEVVYRTLLANCVGAVNKKKSEEVFNKMRDMGLEITSFACNQLLLLYKRLDKKKIADVLLFMEKENIKPSQFTYKLLIDTKGQSNDITGMEQLMETMKEQGFEPDTNTLSVIARHYINGGLKAKAEAILKEIEGSDLKDNRGACRALLPLYADLGKADEVSRVWKACESNARVDECLAAIEAWGKLGKVEAAEAVFDRMLQTWKKLSARNYTTLLKVYANHKMLNKGKDLAKRMAESGCHIGPWTWDALVKLYVEAGEVEKADSILNKAVQQNKTKPLFSSFMTVLDQYAKKGDIHNAEKMFHRLRQSGYVGRVRQYESLLRAYVNAKAPAYGFKDRMKADNVFPSKMVATLLVQIDAFKKTAISDLLD